MHEKEGYPAYVAPASLKAPPSDVRRPSKTPRLQHLHLHLDLVQQRTSIPISASHSQPPSPAHDGCTLHLPRAHFRRRAPDHQRRAYAYLGRPQRPADSLPRTLKLAPPPPLVPFPQSTSRLILSASVGFFKVGKSIFVRSIDDPSDCKEYTGHTATTTIARFSPMASRLPAVIPRAC